MFSTCTPRAQKRPAMELLTQSGRGHGRLRRLGFTLIELMIVMSIIVILLGVAIPFYQKSIMRAKETVLHNNLFAMRSAIDEYSYDKQKAPQSLQDLVTEATSVKSPKIPSREIPTGKS